MMIAKLTIKFDRGLLWNKPQDVGLEKMPEKASTDGGIVRGLGTRYKDLTTMNLVKEREREDNRIRTLFKSQFPAIPLDGCYLISYRGEAKEFLKNLVHRDDVTVTVSEYVLNATGDMTDEEIKEWRERIKKQLGSIRLGRGKDIDDEGLTALETLAKSPIFKAETRDAILNMVESVRIKKTDRVEVRRTLATLDVQLDVETLNPRRTHVVEEEAAVR